MWIFDVFGAVWSMLSYSRDDLTIVCEGPGLTSDG